MAAGFRSPGKLGAQVCGTCLHKFDTQAETSLQYYLDSWPARLPREIDGSNKPWASEMEWIAVEILKGNIKAKEGYQPETPIAVKHSFPTSGMPVAPTSGPRPSTPPLQKAFDLSSSYTPSLAEKRDMQNLGQPPQKRKLADYLPSSENDHLGPEHSIHERSKKSRASLYRSLCRKKVIKEYIHCRSGRQPILPA